MAVPLLPVVLPTFLMPIRPSPVRVSITASRQIAACLQSAEEQVKELLSQLDKISQDCTNSKNDRQKEEAALFDRKVTVFGARLDDDVAGQGVLEKDREEEHEQLFAAGVKFLSRGEYSSAVTAFTRATAAAPGGLTRRKGGQYAIYLAQALHADGRKQQAVRRKISYSRAHNKWNGRLLHVFPLQVGLLKRCEAHPDKDIRKIADQVLYVMQVTSDLYVGLRSATQN